MKPWLIYAALVLVLARATCPAGEEIVYKGYLVHNWPSAGQLEALRQVAGENGRVIEERASGKLLILATTNAHAQIAALLKDVDVPVRNVRIDINSRRIGTQEKSGFEVQGSGRVAVTRDGVGYKVKIRPVVVDEMSGSDSLVQQTIVVADGSEGSFVVSQQVPQLDWLWETGKRWGCIRGDVAMQEVGAFLNVQAFVMGDGQSVRMKLTPELRGVVGKRPMRVQFTKVSTEVTVRNGASFPIGGFSNDEHFSSKFLVGFSSEGMSQSLQITVTPRILGPDGRDIQH